MPGTLAKALQALGGSDDVEWAKPEFMSVLLLVKIIVALGVGVAAGVMPIIGAMGFAAYFVASMVVVFLAIRCLRVDEEVLGGHTSLIGDDQQISIPLFALTWILTFSTVWH